MSPVTHSVMPCEEPFFFARMSKHEVEVRGEAERCFGHQLSRADGGIDGIYAEWKWDGRALRVRNDRYGFWPLYYYHGNGAFGVSTSVAKLIAEGASTELNEEAIAVAVRLGQFIGHDTPFRHISCVPPNGRLMWDGGLEVSGGYHFRQPLRGISRDDAMVIYRDLFKGAIARRRPSNGNFAVPLSGGRDSRHILFELCRSGFKPRVCITVQHYPDDVRVAALVSRELGIEHVVMPQENDAFELEYRKNEVTNFCAAQNAWPLLVAPWFAERGIDTIYDGIAGDVLSAGLFLTPELHALFRGRNVPAIAAQLLPDNEAVLARLLAPDLMRRWSRALALERMSAEVKCHLDAHNPATSFLFWNRTRRNIAHTPYSMYARTPKVYAPYLDHDLFDFLAALPAEMIIDHAFHTDVIRAAYPQWAHLPFEDKSLPGHDFSSQHARFARSFSEFAGLVPRCSWLRQPSFTVRLLASRFSRPFAAQSNWYFRPALWFMQLEGVARSAARRAHG